MISSCSDTQREALGLVPHHEAQVDFAPDSARSCDVLRAAPVPRDTALGTVCPVASSGWSRVSLELGASPLGGGLRLYAAAMHTAWFAVATVGNVRVATVQDGPCAVTRRFASAARIPAWDGHWGEGDITVWDKAWDTNWTGAWDMGPAYIGFQSIDTGAHGWLRIVPVNDGEAMHIAACSAPSRLRLQRRATAVVQRACEGGDVEPIRNWSCKWRTDTCC